jgi:hypothetical protein
LPSPAFARPTSLEIETKRSDSPLPNSTDGHLNITQGEPTNLYSTHSRFWVGDIANAILADQSGADQGEAAQGHQPTWLPPRAVRERMGTLLR